MNDPSAPVRPRRATIRDVAQRAGVSKSLASLVYSAPENVGAARRERVLAAAAELGYRPNRVARSLSGMRDDIVGILVADPRNPVLADVSEAARARLALDDVLGLSTSAVRAGTEDPEPDVDVLGMIADLRPARVLIVGSVPRMARLVSAVAPARVVVASALSGGAAVCSVHGDDRAGMREVVAHLRERGHRRIAHLGGVGLPVVRARADAFRAAVSGVEGGWVEAAGLSERSGHEAALRALSDARAPTALVAVNDLCAVGALAAVREMGLAGRVAVTGYDNTYLAALGAVSLTSVEPGNDAIGTMAAELLLADAPSVGETLVAPELVVRASTSEVRVGL